MRRAALTVIALFLCWFRAIEIPVLYAAYGCYVACADSTADYIPNRRMRCDDSVDRYVNLSATEKAADKKKNKLRHRLYRARRIRRRADNPLAFGRGLSALSFLPGKEGLL